MHLKREVRKMQVLSLHANVVKQKNSWKKATHSGLEEQNGWHIAVGQLSMIFWFLYMHNTTMVFQNYVLTLIWSQQKCIYTYAKLQRSNSARSLGTSTRSSKLDKGLFIWASQDSAALSPEQSWCWEWSPICDWKHYGLEMSFSDFLLLKYYAWETSSRSKVVC